MMSTTHNRLLIFSLVGLFLVGLGLLLIPLEATVAQPSRPQQTRVPQGQVAITPPARDGQGGASATLQVPDRATLAFQTPNADNLTATVQAISTHIPLDPAAIQATASALLTSIPAFPADFPSEELLAWINTVLEMGEVTYDPNTGTISVTAALPEAAVDTALEAALTAGGYETSALTLDFVDGAIIVTAEDVTINDQLSGTVQATLALSVVDGAVVVEVTQVTLNGQVIPVDLLDDWAAAIEQELIAAMIAVPEGMGYTVDAIYVTDDSIVLSVTVTVPTA